MGGIKHVEEGEIKCVSDPHTLEFPLGPSIPQATRDLIRGVPTLRHLWSEGLNDIHESEQPVSYN